MDNSEVISLGICQTDRYQTEVRHDIYRMVRSGLSEGIDKTVERLKDYARNISSDRGRFGIHAYPISVFAYRLIDVYFPGDTEVEAYIGCMSLDS